MTVMNSNKGTDKRNLYDNLYDPISTNGGLMSTMNKKNAYLICGHIFILIAFNLMNERKYMSFKCMRPLKILFGAEPLPICTSDFYGPAGLSDCSLVFICATYIDVLKNIALP